MQLLDEFCALHPPLQHQGMGELDPETDAAPANAIQRQPVSELAHDEVGQQARRGHALRDRRQHRQLRSHHRSVAVATGHFTRCISCTSSRAGMWCNCADESCPKGLSAPSTGAMLLLLRQVDPLDDAQQTLQHRTTPRRSAGGAPEFDFFASGTKTRRQPGAPAPGAAAQALSSRFCFRASRSIL